MPQVMSGDDIGRAMRRISHEIIETHTSTDRVVLVGIHTRGVHLARMLVDHIQSLAGQQVPLGELDIGLYRDDRDHRGQTPSKPTHIPSGITNSNLIIVDDVLYTGRTVRAALDAMTDFGRALTTELVVLVDRGHRELPIRADYVGKNLPTSRDEIVRVRLTDVDGREGVWIESKVAA